MWIVTVFENNTYRMFEFSGQQEAKKLAAKFKDNAILSFTK